MRQPNSKRKIIAEKNLPQKILRQKISAQTTDISLGAHLIVRVLNDVATHHLAEILGALLDHVGAAEGQLVELKGNLRRERERAEVGGSGERKCRPGKKEKYEYIRIESNTIGL